MTAGECAFTAVMSFRDGRWRVFVALPGLVSQWPEHHFPKGHRVPTLAARSRALNMLGFEFTGAAEWEWNEDVDGAGDDASPVQLIACTSVRRTDGGAR